MTKVVQYIIQFLLGENATQEAISSVGYTSDPNLFNKYKIVIHPSNFFDNDIYGRQESIPQLPLKTIERDIPLLFGDEREVLTGDTLIIYADIIASSFFLISRYEETVNRSTRDEHGRFPGKASLPYQAQFINRPIVEEYGSFLRNKLKGLGIDTSDEEQKIKSVYLTHDVDSPFFCRTWRNVVRETLNGGNIFLSAKRKFGALYNDANFTFPWLFNENSKLTDKSGEKKCQSVVFFKVGGNTKQDKPVYSISGSDIKTLFDLCDTNNVAIGLHSSYQAGMQPELIAKEKQQLEKALTKRVRFNRHHFLSCREPEDMELLIKAGIEEDFTMGYADAAGFRLGTCRPVQWINPVTKEITPLLLHPLTIMDRSLVESKYMGLSYEQALDYCKGLIEQTALHNGEITLLWHNTSVTEYSKDYLKQLYKDLLNEIEER